MNWEDERYVRLYTRDTITWKLLGWEGRFVMMSLLRKVDRAGCLDLEAGTEGLAALLEMPEEIVQVGLAACAKRGTVQLRGHMLVLPRFIEAQEAKQSDRQRQRECREKRRDLGERAKVVGLSREPTDQSQIVTEQPTMLSQNVTKRHTDSSAGVTLSCAVLSQEFSHTPAQVNPGNPRPKPGPDDDAVKAWKAIETGAGGPQGLGIDRKPAGTQELWLDDNRAVLWVRNWHTLRQAEPPYTLADCERLGRWIAAGGTGDFKTPWQMLSKAGKAPDISAWFSLALRWDPLTDPRANRPPSRVTAAAPAMPPRDYPETLAKRQADAIERGDLPEADPAVIEEQLRKMREATA